MQAPKKPMQQWPVSKREQPLCAGCLGRPPHVGDYCLECYDDRILAPGAGGFGD